MKSISQLFSLTVKTFYISVGFSFSENKGKLMENAVFLQLRRKQHDVYYYKTAKGYEVDFFLPKEGYLIQSVQQFDSLETQKEN